MSKQSVPIIYLAPLQGFTDFVFRRNFASVFGGIDKYFCPYISFSKHDMIRNSQQKDVLPHNNGGMQVVPQVLFSDVDEFRRLCSWLVDWGYREINMNLGCPYPMATNRGRGAAMLQKPEMLSEILQIAFDEFDVAFSVKMRLGLELTSEVFPVMEVINRFPISELIVHPRIGKQMYKGEVNIEQFSKVKALSVHPVVFNGDIRSANDIERIQQLVPEQNAWMIGRGVLMNPLLPLTLKNESAEGRNEMLRLFHQKMLDDYAAILQGDGHLLQKMLGFWEYFSDSFTDSHKAFKRIKKASSLEKYHSAVKDIFDQFLDGK